VTGSKTKEAPVLSGERRAIAYENIKTELYRHYNGEGVLLYIGISLDTIVRLRNHEHYSSWFSNIARITIERFPTRSEAEKAEQTAILTEKPLFNRMHNPLADRSEICRQAALRGWELRRLREHGIPIPVRPPPIDLDELDLDPIDLEELELA
jgi:hypothetical protein